MSNVYKLKKEDRELIEFYLINCPVDYKKKKTKEYVVVSHKGPTFTSLNYQSAEITKLLKTFNKTINNNIVRCSNHQEVEAAEARIKHDKGYSDRNFEYVAIIENTDMFRTRTLFYMIRNALAHGSFENKDKVYYFKAEKDKKLKALMRLKYTTLIDLKNRFLNKNFEIEKIKKG